MAMTIDLIGKAAGDTEPVAEQPEQVTQGTKVISLDLADFESRFVKNWNAHIHREVQRNPGQELPRNERGREVFRYEHPDRVREARNGK